ncbi:cell division protein FtsQ [Bacillus sp. cl95]|nr:cell division protein FtsQ [Bacillus sp. UNCCL13]SFQ65530.1 cell division protein FtsQ [Bacillus sp. cl95]
MKGVEKGKIVSLEERIPKLKQQRRRKANKRLIMLLLLFFFMIACVVYVQSPLSRIKTITVTGNASYSKNDIIAKSGLTFQTNVWKVNKKTVEAQIMKLPEVKKATVRVQFPNIVKVNVKEHKRIAYLSDKKAFYPVLQNGKILKESTKQLPGNAPVLGGFKEGKVLDELISSLDDLPLEVKNSISEIHYAPSKTDRFHITLFMNDGFEVSASLRSFAEKMAHYPSIISQLDPKVKGVIDLEVGSYFKAYGQEGDDEVEENKDESEG